MKPKVSILIPVYNREFFIAECIQSALDQTFTDFEVVVVDNSSDDGTWEVCQRFAIKDTRVRIFRNETNIGPVRNWRRCAEEANGEFSKILFSDDLLHPNCLSVMVPKLEDPEISLVYSSVKTGKNINKSETNYRLRRNGNIKNRLYLKLILQGRAPVSPGAALIRTKDILRNIHTDFPTATQRSFDKHGAGPDVMILILTSESYNQVSYCKDSVVFFRQHSGSFSMQNYGNEIVKSYVSVLSYYLLKIKKDRNLWMQFMGDSWIKQMQFTRKWLNTKYFLVSNDGDGTTSEQSKLILIGLFRSPIPLINRIINCIYRLFPILDNPL